MKEILRLKNWLKARLRDDGAAYRFLKACYAKIIFPLQERSWKRKTGAGFESEESLYMCSLLPKRTIDIVIEHYAPKTWLDVGCGTGAGLKYIRNLGVAIWGLEYSELAIRESGIAQWITRVDLTRPIELGRRFDVVWCYEVAEHLPEAAADVLLDTLCRHSDTVIISAAVPGQGGEGHINEQPIQYWVGKMNDRGFRIDSAPTERIRGIQELFSANLTCYRSGHG